MIELPPGFLHVDRWALQHAPLADLILTLNLHQPTIRVFGREHLTPRLVSWMGTEAYTYSGQRHEPAPLPIWVENTKRALEKHTGARFNSVLANYYRDGQDSVAWHADDEPELGPTPTIASVSFGAPRTFAIKVIDPLKRGPAVKVELGDGDLLIMHGNSQRDYWHALLKTAKPTGPRLNLTFRWIGEGGR